MEHTGLSPPFSADTSNTTSSGSYTATLPPKKVQRQAGEEKVPAYAVAAPALPRAEPADEADAEVGDMSVAELDAWMIGPEGLDGTIATRARQTERKRQRALATEEEEAKRKRS